MFNFAPAIPSRSDLDWCWYLRRQGQPGEALERALHNIGVMDPGGWADWKPSTLTDTGAPVEMAFSATQTALQLTTEVGDPGADRTRRVAQVCKIIADLGGTAPTAALRDVISAAQGTADLRYGAWLGLRQAGTRLDTMLYAELPADAADLSTLMSPAPFSAVLDELGGDAHATMLGYDGRTGQVTIYCEAHNVMRSVLPALAEPAQVSADVLSLSIDGLTEGMPSMALPTSKLGFSYTMTGDETPPQLTLYFSSRDLFGTDAAISRRIKACGGHALTGYAALADNQPPAPIGQTHHGKIGMTARQNAAPVLSVGVAAPWFCDFVGS